MTQQEIGKLIKEARISKGYTAKKLANLMGISTLSTIYRWECGERKPRLTQCQKLSKLLGIKINLLTELWK